MSANNFTKRDLNYATELSQMIQCDTVSVCGDVNPDKFRAFHQILARLFPNIWSKCDVEDYSGSLLLKWPGKTSENPILFMHHHDVVNADGDWTHAPFSGEISDGKIWGRGTLDTKNGLFAMLKAADELAESGFVPEQDIYFESACTEETDGTGAEQIVETLKSRGITLKFVLDEGGYILHDPIGMADHDFAVVGVAEKGTADIKFTARSAGGHASMPGPDTPLIQLSKFMLAVERSHAFKPRLKTVTREFFRRCAPYVKGPLKFVFKNIDFFAPLMVLVMPRVSNAANAMMRTTIAFTRAQGSGGNNVLPEEAWVIGNMRFSHHQGQEASFAAVRKIAEKYGIEMEVLDPGFDSGVSKFKSEEFGMIETAVSKFFPGVTTVPYIGTSASDARYFTRICKKCFRFAPFKISDEQLKTVHGIDENLDINTLSTAVDFYKFLMGGTI